MHLKQKYDEATRRLLRFRGRFHHLGESNAENDLFDLLLMDSYVSLLNRNQIYISDLDLQRESWIRSLTRSAFGE